MRPRNRTLEQRVKCRGYFDPDLSREIEKANLLDTQVTLNAEIEYLNKADMDGLRFSDFSELRSGRDEYSGIRINILREMVDEQVKKAAEETWHDSEKLQAQLYRWILRGLNLDKALRKVATDAEISQNAARARYK